MSLSIRIKGAEFTRDTELLGSMVPFWLKQAPYILVRNMQGAEIKRTAISKGRNPVYEDLFMVPVGTPALEFIALDKEGGVKAIDDVIGGAFVPITFEGKTAGRIILEVLAGGYPGGYPGGMGNTMMGGAVGSGFGPGMIGSGFAPGMAGNGYGPGMAGSGFASGMAGNGFGQGMVGSGFGPGMGQPGMAMTTGGGGGYTAKTTTTTTEVSPGVAGYSTMGQNFASTTMGGATYGSTMMAGSPYPVGGMNSFVPPPMAPPMPPGGFASNLGPRPISSGMMGINRPISPNFIGGPPGGFMGAPVMNRPMSVAPFGAGGAPFGGPQFAETTTTTISNGPPQMSGPPIMTSGIMNSGFMNAGPPMGSVIGPSGVMASGLRGSFVNQPGQVTTTVTSSGMGPQMMGSGLRRSFVAPPLPPASPVYPAPSSVIRSGIMQQPGLGSNIVVNPGMTNSFIAPGGTTTVTEVTEVNYNPGMTTVTSNIGGQNMNAMAGVAGVAALGANGPMGMSGFNQGMSGQNMNAMAGMAAMGMSGMNQMGMSNIGMNQMAMNGQNMNAIAGMAALGATGAMGVNQMGMSAMGPVASVGGGAMMPGPTGMGVDMAGRLVDMGRIRLEKIEHYPSFNLFSMLDDHPPMATFRVMPHKLRNY